MKVAVALLRNCARGLALVVAFLIATVGSQASQNSCILATTGQYSGLTLVNNINACSDSILSLYSGASAPASPVDGMLWRDTSVSPSIVKQYANSDWSTVWYVDSDNHLTLAPIGGGTATRASATTTNIGLDPQAVITISGTTEITSFGSSAITGTLKVLVFASTPNLKFNASSLILPGGADIPARAGDVAVVAYLGGGNWRVASYERADGTAISTNSAFGGAVSFASPISITLASNTDDWNPSGLATANVVRLTCSSAINITGLSAPATDGKIVVVDNVGATNNCTLMAQDAGSAAANRFAFSRAMVVRPGRSLTIKYDATGARWRLIQEMVVQPVAGGFKNLRVYNVATFFGDAAPTTPNNQMVVKADQITVEDVSGGAERLSSVNCTADVTTSGVGGLDSGIVTTSQWYSLWVIYAPATNATSCVLSTSATSPALPTGYTYKARVNWNKTDASSRFNRIIQYGRRAMYVVTGSAPAANFPTPASNTAGNVSTPVWASVGLSSYVPATAADVCGIVSSVPTALAMVAPNNSFGPVLSATNPPPIIVNATATAFGQGSVATPFCFALESTNIYWASNGTNNLLQITGWEDNL